MHNDNRPGVILSFRKKIILMFLGVIFSTILIESGLRLGGFIFLSLQESRNSAQVNKIGGYRIMCLGESTTAGGSDAYPAQLEEILNQRNTGITFCVINKGAVAVDTVSMVSQLEGNLNRYQPHMVTAMIGDNDRYVKYYENIPDAATPLFKNFRTYRLVRIMWANILRRAKGSVVPRFKFQQASNRDKDLGLEDYNKYYKKGCYYRDSGQYSESEAAFRKAIELNPREDKTYVELGLCYKVQGKHSQAEEALKEAIKINPLNEIAQRELVWFYTLRGKYGQAEQAFKRAVELNPKNDKPYIELGFYYRARKKYALAEKAFKKATELNPGNNIAYTQSGWCALYQGKPAQAEEAFQKVLVLNPKDEAVYRGLAILSEEVGKPESAREYYKKTNELNPRYYSQMTRDNYHKIKEVLDKRKIRLVCIQYPMRSIDPLKMIFDGEPGSIFVDNERIFKDAVKKDGFKEYFSDMFAGDFGHCTLKGNRLLAENIANVILKEYFNK